MTCTVLLRTVALDYQRTGIHRQGLAGSLIVMIRMAVCLAAGSLYTPKIILNILTCEV